MTIAVIIAFVLGLAVGAFAMNRFWAGLSASMTAVALHKAGIGPFRAAEVVDSISRADLSAAYMDQYDFGASPGVTR